MRKTKKDFVCHSIDNMNVRKTWGKGKDKEIIINDSFVDKNFKKCNFLITPEKREIMVHSFTYFMFLLNYFLM